MFIIQRFTASIILTCIIRWWGHWLFRIFRLSSSFLFSVDTSQHNTAKNCQNYGCNHSNNYLNKKWFSHILLFIEKILFIDFIDSTHYIFDFHTETVLSIYTYYLYGNGVLRVRYLHINRFVLMRGNNHTTIAIVNIVGCAR